MRIDAFQSSSPISPSGRSEAAPSSRPASRSAAEPVSLSPLGSLMMSAQQALRALPAVRDSRVQELGGAVATGQYQSNPDNVAAAMIGAEGA